MEIRQDCFTFRSLCLDTGNTCSKHFLFDWFFELKLFYCLRAVKFLAALYQGILRYDLKEITCENCVPTSVDNHPTPPLTQPNRCVKTKNNANEMVNGSKRLSYGQRRKG